MESKKFNYHDKNQLDFNNEMVQMNHFLPKEELNGKFKTENITTKFYEHSDDDLNTRMRKNGIKASEFEDRIVEITHYKQQGTNIVIIKSYRYAIYPNNLLITYAINA